MERFTGYGELKNAWTYDHVKVKDVIGSIRDPYVLTTESGLGMVPASIVYLQASNGTRTSPFMSGLYKKVLYEYSKAGDYMQENLYPHHLGLVIEPANLV